MGGPCSWSTAGASMKYQVSCALNKGPGNVQAWGSWKTWYPLGGSSYLGHTIIRWIQMKQLPLISQRENKWSFVLFSLIILNHHMKCFVTCLSTLKFSVLTSYIIGWTGRKLSWWINSSIESMLLQLSNQDPVSIKHKKAYLAFHLRGGLLVSVEELLLIPGKAWFFSHCYKSSGVGSH